MRILFLHEVNYLTKPIFEMHEFPEQLVQLGNDVGFVQFPEGLPGPELSKTPFRQVISGRVLRSISLTLFTPKSISGGLAGRLSSALTFRPAFRRILAEFEPDIVVCFSVPTSGWQALNACNKAGVPFVFRALDVSHKIRKTIFSLPIAWAERFIYRNADWVSANNPAMLAYVLANGGMKVKAGVNFPPLAHGHFARELSENRVRRAQLGIPEDAKVLLYMGSFFYFSGLPDVIRGFAKKAESSDYLILIGQGEQEQELKTIVTDLGVQDRVLFTGLISFSDLPSYLGMADVSINPLRPSLVSHAALPNKVLQYMASGSFVVSTRLNGLELSLGNELPGLMFVDDATELIRAALDLAHGPSDLKKLGADNAERVKRLFAPELAVRTFQDRLQTLVNVGK